VGLVSFAVTWPVTWPVVLVRGVIRVGQVLQQQAERELHDPAVVRRQLEELEELRVAGQISEEEEARAQREILSRLISQPSLTGSDPGRGGEGP
jgi:cytochrome c-type biogenesis protein CcmH/NrfG